MRSAIVCYLRRATELSQDNEIVSPVINLLSAVPDCNMTEYTKKMEKHTEFGDHITLQAAAQHFSIDIVVLSSKGKKYNTVVSPICSTENSSPEPLPYILLGHFAEGDGTHYVAISSDSEQAVNELGLLSSQNLIQNDRVSIPSASSEMSPTDQFTSQESCVSVTHRIEAGSSLSETTPVANNTPCTSTCSPDANAIDQLSTAKPNHIYDVDQLPVHCSGKKIQRLRKFCTEWYKQFPWLHWVNGRLLCHTCCAIYEQKNMIQTNKYENTFIKSGYSCNWKKAVEKFQEHELSGMHRESNEKAAFILGRVNISHLLDKHVEQEQKASRRALHAIATTLLTLAQTGCAFRGHDNDEGNVMSWLNLRAADIPELKAFLGKRLSFLTGDIQNELLSLMHNDLLRQVIKKIKQSPYFGVILDETTDVSTKEQVSICLRYLTDDITPVEVFVGLYEVNSTTGENLCSVLLDVLKRLDLPITGLRSQCYDGASNMSGEFQGLQSRIKKIQPLAVYIHCYAHSLNLVLQEAARQVPIFRDSLEFLHRAAILMGRSAKRKSILETYSAEIKPMCPTRWSVRAQAVKTALKNYEGIMGALDEVAESSSSDAAVEARSLLQQFDKSHMYFCLLVAESVFEPADRLSTILQSPNMTASSGLAAAKATYQLLSSLRTQTAFDKFMEQTEVARNKFQLQALSRPRTRKPPKRIDSGAKAHEMSIEEYYRQHYFMVMSFVIILLLKTCMFSYVILAV